MYFFRTLFLKVYFVLFLKTNKNSIFIVGSNKQLGFLTNSDLNLKLCVNAVIGEQKTS